MDETSKIPRDTWERRLDSSDPPKSVHNFARPPLLEALSLLPVAYRVGGYLYEERRNGREPIFDLNGIGLEPPNPGPYAGVPCGGLKLSCSQELWRYEQTPPHIMYYTASSCSSCQVLSMMDSSSVPDLLSSWTWNLDPSSGTYFALFPRSWTVYKLPVIGVRVCVRQVSPFLPHSYSEASLPVSVFHVEVENTGEDDIEAYVMFTFQNSGDDEECKGGKAGGTVATKHDTFEFNYYEDYDEDIYKNVNSNNNDYDRDINFEGDAIKGEEIASNIKSRNGSIIKGVTMKNYKTFKQSNTKNSFSKNVCKRFSAKKETKSRKEDCRKEDKSNFPGKDFVNESDSESDQSEENSDVRNRINGSYAIAAMCEVCSCHDKRKNENGNEKISGASSCVEDLRCDLGTISVCREFLVQPGKDKIRCESIKSADLLWQQFQYFGDINAQSHEKEYSFLSFPSDAKVASAVCMKKKIKGNISKSARTDSSQYKDDSERTTNKKTFSFSLSWDNPIVRFGGGASGVENKDKIPTSESQEHKQNKCGQDEVNSESVKSGNNSYGFDVPRYYSRFFGDSGHVACMIASYGLIYSSEWENRIVTWQNSVLSKAELALNPMIKKEKKKKIENNKKCVSKNGDVININRDDRNFDDKNDDGESNDDINNDKFDNDTDCNEEEDAIKNLVPEFYRYQLFNELYFLVDGGSVWTDSTYGVASTYVSHNCTDINKCENDGVSKNRDENEDENGNTTSDDYGDDDNNLDNKNLHNDYDNCTKKCEKNPEKNSATTTPGNNCDEKNKNISRNKNVSQSEIRMGRRTGMFCDILSNILCMVNENFNFEDLISTSHKNENVNKSYLHSVSNKCSKSYEKESSVLEVEVEVEAGVYNVGNQNASSISTSNESLTRPLLSLESQNDKLKIQTNRVVNTVKNQNIKNSGVNTPVKKIKNANTTTFSSHIISKAISCLHRAMLNHDEKVAHSEIAGDQSLVGQFLYLEGHEYLMYNTYDVHFYSGFSLLMLWPHLEFSLQRDFTRSVPLKDFSMRVMMGTGATRIRKMKGAVPHDLGSPSGRPWHKTNAYNFQDVSNWKDLGPKFVLQIYRDFCHLRKNKNGKISEEFLASTYDTVLTVMIHTLQFDTDKDGMIENSGFPDQTYDIWTATGVHAYCGGLWICACSAAAAMALVRNDRTNEILFSSLEERAREVYVRTLWNGQYLHYDSSSSMHHDSIMADMMAGQWYSRACGLPSVVPSEMALSCYQTIYRMNVLAFGAGKLLGAVNGMRPSGVVDNSCMQSREVWTGTTYALSAGMILEALSLRSNTRNLDFKMPVHSDIDNTKEKSKDGARVVEDIISMAFNTAKGIHDAGWQDFGYWFATPESWEKSGHYRSLGYMRPLAVWAMQYALESYENGDENGER